MAVLLICEDSALLTEHLSKNEYDVAYLWSGSIVEHPGFEGHVLSGMTQDVAEKYGNWTEIVEIDEKPTPPPKPTKPKAKGGKKGGSKASKSVRSGD